MPERYSRRPNIKNVSKRYIDYFRKRAGKSIHNFFIPVQYASPALTYPSDDEILNYMPVSHIWKQGDSFYKLAHEFYGDSRMWWIIPWFNKKPLVTDYKLGDHLEIPTNIQDAYEHIY